MKLYALYFPTWDSFVRLGSNHYVDLLIEKRCPPIFVPEHYFHLMHGMENPGGRSLLLFDQRHVDFAYEYPNDWNGKQFPVYSNFMMLDLDHQGPESVAKLCEFFKEYDYLVYASGGDNKFHFILPHNLIINHNFKLCYEAFMIESRIVWDSSVYSSVMSGMNLPGTINLDTGRRKELVKANAGKKWFFDERPSPDKMLNLGRRFFKGEKG